MSSSDVERGLTAREKALAVAPLATFVLTYIIPLPDGVSTTVRWVVGAVVTFLIYAWLNDELARLRRIPGLFKSLWGEPSPNSGFFLEAGGAVSRVGFRVLFNPASTYLVGTLLFIVCLTLVFHGEPSAVFQAVWERIRGLGEFSSRGGPTNPVRLAANALSDARFVLGVPLSFLLPVVMVKAGFSYIEKVGHGLLKEDLFASLKCSAENPCDDHKKIRRICGKAKEEFTYSGVSGFDLTCAPSEFDCDGKEPLAQTLVGLRTKVAIIVADPLQRSARFRAFRLHGKYIERYLKPYVELAIYAEEAYQARVDEDGNRTNRSFFVYTLEFCPRFRIVLNESVVRAQAYAGLRSGRIEEALVARKVGPSKGPYHDLVERVSGYSSADRGFLASWETKDLQYVCRVVGVSGKIVDRGIPDALIEAMLKGLDSTGGLSQRYAALQAKAV